MSQNLEKTVVKLAIHVLKKHWKVILLGVILASAGASLQHFLFPQFVASSSLVVKSAEESSLLKAVGMISGFRGNPYSTESPSGKMVKTLRSKSFRDFVKNYLESPAGIEVLKEYASFRRTHLDRIKRAKENPALYPDEIVGGLSFKAAEELIEIQSTARKREVASLVSRTGAILAQKYLTDYEMKEISDTDKYLRKELKDAEERMRNINIQIDDLRFKTGIVSVGEDNEGSVLLNSIKRMQEEIALVEVKISENTLLTDQLLKELGISDPKNIQDDPNWWINMRGRSVDRLKDLKFERDVHESKLKALNAKYTALTAKYRPSQNQNIFDLKKRLDIEHNLYKELHKQLLDSQIYQIAVINKVRVYDLADEFSAVPYSSLSQKVMISSLFALFLVIFGLYIWRQIHPTVLSKTDLIQLGIPIIGNISQMFASSNRLIQSQADLAPEVKLHNILKTKVRSPETTELQFLASRLITEIEKVNGKRKGIITFVSSSQKDGKTFVSSALASTLGTLKFRVLVVDGDFMRDRIHPYFGIPNGSGLTDFLSGSKTLNQIINKTDLDNVDFIPVGNEHSHLNNLLDDKLGQLLRLLSQEYDLILIDTPAFMVGPETLVFCDYSDICVTVAAANITLIEQVRDVFDALASRGQNNIIGILNKVERSGSRENYVYATSESQRQTA